MTFKLYTRILLTSENHAFRLYTKTIQKLQPPATWTSRATSPTCRDPFPWDGPEHWKSCKQGACRVSYSAGSTLKMPYTVRRTYQLQFSNSRIIYLIIHNSYESQLITKTIIQYQQIKVPSKSCFHTDYNFCARMKIFTNSN